MTHIESFSKSLKIFWIKKILDNSILTEWKTLISDLLVKVGGNNIWHYHPTALTNLAKKFNPFWQNIIEIWSELYCEISNPRCEPLWFNSKIQMGGEMVFFKNWHNAGVNCINDLLNNNGVFFNCAEFNQQYNLNENFIRFSGIVSAIPREWKQEINDVKTKLDVIEYENIEMVKSKNKINKWIYEKLVEKIREKPTELQRKWQDILNNNNFEITEYFSLMHKTVKDTTLKNMQFKILHRILPTNKLLYQMKIINYNSCYFCSTHLETLEHFFFECIEIKNIWLKLYDDLRLHDIFENLVFNLETVLFGYRSKENKYILGINTFIILIKFYIFGCKNNNKRISYDSAKHYLKYQCRIHRDIAGDVGGDWAFLDVWYG